MVWFLDPIRVSKHLSGLGRECKRGSASGNPSGLTCEAWNRWNQQAEKHTEHGYTSTSMRTWAGCSSAMLHFQLEKIKGNISAKANGLSKATRFIVWVWWFAIESWRQCQERVFWGKWSKRKTRIVLVRKMKYNHKIHCAENSIFFSRLCNLHHFLLLSHCVFYRIKQWWKQGWAWSGTQTCFNSFFFFVVAVAEQDTQLTRTVILHILLWHRILAREFLPDFAKIPPWNHHHQHQLRWHVVLQFCWMV